MGPTASGKTAVAVDLVQRFPLEIISVDSALVYRGMDIGTAKPDAALLRLAPHRLIDIRDPAEPYSAAGFRRDALVAMADIRAQGRIPLLVGGTFLYFRALQQGLSEMPAADPGLRAQLEAEVRAGGLPQLHARLAQVDPEAAARIQPTDPQRIQRALEVYEATGRPLSAWHAQGRAGNFPWRVLRLVLLPADRDVLHARIEARFRAMLAAGFVDEVRGLYARDYLHGELPAMRAVGYRQAWAWLAGETGFDEMVERAIIATRQYAKRQLTWLRAETDIECFPAEQEPRAGCLAERVREWLQL
jgi:tRNA dimethylallyltransferase